MGRIRSVSNIITQSSQEAVRKTADQTVSNSTTLVNVNDLLKTIGDSEVYDFELFLKVLGFGASDIKFGFSVPSGAVLTWGVDDSALDKTASDTVSVSLTDSVNQIVKITGKIINSTTAGNLQLKFAQAVAVAENTKILKESTIKTVQINPSVVDQTNITGAEIKALYEAEADTNAFTDAEKTKLTGIETGATADQTGAEIKALYEAEANAFTDTKNTKLAGIATGATANDTDANLKARANHTGTQLASTISDLATEILARSKHTGTQLASTISDLATVVKAYKLSEFANPDATLNINSQSLTSVKKVENTISAVSNDTTAIDFSGDDIITETITGSITFTTTNKTAGRKKLIVLDGGASARGLTFPSWTWLVTAPTITTSNKKMIISLLCTGTTDASVIASYKNEV